MAKFLRVGHCWINLELVTTIVLVESRKKPEEVAVARVCYTNGKHEDFKRPEQVQVLCEFLESHQAE